MTARIQLPRSAKRGELVEIRIAVQHPMETGYRMDDLGRAIPKNVINNLVCRYNGVEVFRAELGSGIAANPYLDFYTVADGTGVIEFAWVDDEGKAGSERASLTVTG